jgi:hypothetical protein
MYERGSIVPQNFTQALKWYAVAAESGDKVAAVAFDELAKKLNPVQVAAARRQAQGFVPQDKQAKMGHWRLSISQKEPELLEKVRAQMDSNARIKFSEKRGVAGAIHKLAIDNPAVCADLRQLGVTPRKSLTITFPPMPPHVVRDFIRGCWDGDGSVYLEGNDAWKPCVSYISGSKNFIEQLVRHLVDLGLPNRTIHIRNPAKRGAHRSYYFRFTGRDCVVLYHALYDKVDESLCLSRKRDRFKAIIDHYECQVNPVQHQVPVRRRIRSLSEQTEQADVALRGGITNRVTIQLRAQQVKAANAELKKKLETFTSTKPPVPKEANNPAPNLEGGGGGGVIKKEG